MILNNLIKFCRVDRDASKGLYLHLLYNIIDEEGKKIIRKINLDNESILTDSNYIDTPYNNYEFIYLNKEYLYKTTSNLKIKVTNEEGKSLEENITLQNFKATFQKRENGNSFFWSVENFSDINIYSYLKLYDSNRRLLKTTKRQLVLGHSKKQNLIETIDDSEEENILINENNYIIEVIVYAEGKEYTLIEKSFYYNKNNNPSINLQSAKIRRNGDSYNLIVKALFRDVDLDNVTYNIYDSDMNTIYMRDSYKYSPAMETINYLYENSLFNRLNMTIFAECKDSNTMFNKTSITIPVYSITNLRRERKRLTWEYSNYSNVRLNMQVEVLDFKDNIIYKGQIFSLTESKDKITIVDDNIVDYYKNDLDFDFYRFRLKVWSDAELFTDYYQFKTGTTFVPIKNIPPTLEILSGSLSRNDNNEKIIKLKVFIDDKNGDRLSYTIMNSNNLINKTNIQITPPYTKDLEIKYDYYDNLKMDISFTVYDEFGESTTKDISLKTYEIYDVFVDKGYIFNIVADNMSEKPLLAKIEIFDVTRTKLLWTSKDLEITKTNGKENFKIRWLPKQEGEYNFRLTFFEKDSNDNIIWKEYYYNEVEYPILRIDEGRIDQSVIAYDLENDSNSTSESNISSFIPFKGAKNLSPTIHLNTCQYEENENKAIISLIAELNDPNLDRITYRSKFKINNTEEYLMSESTELLETPYVLSTVKEFNKEDITRSKINYIIESYDEEGLKTIYNGYLNTYDIGEIIRIDTDFYYSYKIYNKKSLKGRIEILDNNGQIYACGNETTLLANSETYNTQICSDFNYFNFELGYYSYRFKVWNEDEKWVEYYPNYEGNTFRVTDDVSLRNNKNILVVKKPNMNFSVRGINNNENYDLELTIDLDENGNIIYSFEDDNEN